MRIEKWLNNSMSAVNGIAIVRVEADEIADIEEMLKVVDGDSVGHFGVKAYIVSTQDPPEIYVTKQKVKKPRMQFGYSNASSMRKKTRYYYVFVNRD